MQPAETLKQRLDLIFLQMDKVTLGDLLSVVRGPDDLGSKEFESAVCKLIWKLDYKSQEYRELNDFLKRMDHYGSVTRQSLHTLAGVDVQVSPLICCFWPAWLCPC